MRTASELIINQIKKNIYEIKKNIKDKIKTLELKIEKGYRRIYINDLIENKAITKSLKSFFTLNQLSQISEETNPLSEITHKRKISCYGIGAIDRTKANLNIREIHPSHFGRICPIETSEGKNAGLILSLAKDVTLDKKGFIQTPFFELINNKINYKKGIIYLTSEQEKNLTIAPSDVDLNKLKTKKCLKRNQTFITGNLKGAKLISFTRNQSTSIGTGLIPFLEHNDANRALMGSNMQRQALPLINSELPLIETGIEAQICKSSQIVELAKKSGLITFLNKRQIIIKSLISTPKIKTNLSIQLKYKKSFNFEGRIEKLKWSKKQYQIDHPRKSNQSTLIRQIPIMNNQTWVKRGQTLTDGNGTLNGKLALGKTILIAYMSWKGYNFEDAIVVSKRLVNTDIFTSVYTKKQKLFFTNKERQEVRIRN